jgi:transcriptional regulator with XRE-family HTH domain
MDILEKLFKEDLGSMPNKFTLGMGKLIRDSRNEEGYSQAELAQLIHRRQASLSDMENGKMQPDAETLLYLSLTLRKPISHFFPGHYGERIRLEKIDPLEQELLMQAHRLDDDDLIRLITQARALADLRSQEPNSQTDNT